LELTILTLLITAVIVIAIKLSVCGNSFTGSLAKHSCGGSMNADEVVENHCKDCCCARAWKALGIAKYTGKSIPEHIVEMREALEFVAEYAEVGEIIERAKDALSGVLVPRVCEHEWRYMGEANNGEKAFRCSLCKHVKYESNPKPLEEKEESMIKFGSVEQRKESKPKRPVSVERIVRLVKDLIYCGHEMADTLQSYEDNKDVLHWLDLENDAKRILAEINEGEGK
jgi:hypothetical protein